jgi:hypothetical protein
VKKSDLSPGGQTIRRINGRRLVFRAHAHVPKGSKEPANPAARAELRTRAGGCRMKLRTLAACVAVLLSGVGAAPSFAGECTGNGWQPTFVRHDAVSPTVYYANLSGGFTAMSDPQQAQATCSAEGVREPIEGQTCAQRNWGDFGCGCNITPSPNITCAAFQSFLRQRGLLR